MLSEILQQLTSQKSSIENDIHATFDELQKTLNVRKSVLLMELEVSYGLKQKVSYANATLLCGNAYPVCSSISEPKAIFGDV